MKTEMFLEGSPVDIIADDQSLITFAIDDIADFASRQTSFSKTIILPGTQNNNKLFGHIFEVGQSNEYSPGLPNVGYNFNASKSASIIIFQDNIQTFKGVLRLLEIDSINGRIEYQTSVFGDLFSLNVALTGELLTDLDFSAYNHVYNHTNIVNSWDNTPGSGYYYPLIDYGNYSTDKHSWDIRTFRPSLYVKEFIDKIFEAANFRYSAALFDSARFKKLVIPNNQKFLFNPDAVLMDVSNPSPTTFSSTLANDELKYQTRDLGTNFTTSDNYTYKYIGAAPITVELTWVVSGNYQGTNQYFLGTRINVTFQPMGEYIPLSATPYAFTRTLKSTVTLNPNDEITTFGNGGGSNTYTVTFTSVELTIKAAVGSLAPLNPGDTIDLNFNLPKNIRQIDFFVSIIQLFNLYVYEDRFDNRLVNISPYIDFYSDDNTNAVDWTYKLNRDKKISLKPMSELNSKIYKFNFTDDTDYYNDLYSKRYGQGYGSYIFDSEFEFTDETNELTLIFAPTPLIGYSGEDKIYPTIFKRTGSDGSEVEEQVDSKIRILQTKKITGVTSWSIKNGATVLTSVTSYGYAGHFDDPDSPNNDLNFGALKELFFTLDSGFLSATQFNLYWSAYMAEITDKDSKLLTGYFYLKPSDILALDFSKYVTIDTVLYRLNKIIDYNASGPGDCQVELLKVIYTTYGEATPLFTATRTEDFTRNDCDEGYEGSTVPFTKTYTSLFSQGEADAEAAADDGYEAEGQAYANDPAHGSCTLISDDVLLSMLFNMDDLFRASMSFEISEELDLNCTITYDINYVQGGVNYNQVTAATLSINAGLFHTITRTITFTDHGGGDITEVTVSFSPSPNPNGGRTITYTSPEIITL